MKNEKKTLELGSLKDLDGPAFDEPWQSEVFALVIAMNQAELFAWKDWAETFTAEIAAAPAKFGESVNETYYRQWLAALERMVGSLGLLEGEDVSSRAKEWSQAYLNTPHGQPILLANGSCPPKIDDHHKHHPQRLPITVIPATV